MFETVQLLAEPICSLLAFSVLIFDIPRYTLSLLSLAFFGVRSPKRERACRQSFGQRDHTDVQRRLGLAPTIASLQRQTLRRVEIIVVDDGSTRYTRVAERARALGPGGHGICHGTRCGRSAAINSAAGCQRRSALDCGCGHGFRADRCRAARGVFSDRGSAARAANIAISNEQNVWTGLQSVEY